MADPKKIDPMLDRHRGGNPANELRRITVVLPSGGLVHSDIPAVPIAGGPHAGQVVHKHPEEVEIELPGPDGKPVAYRREFSRDGKPQFVPINP